MTDSGIISLATHRVLCELRYDWRRHKAQEEARIRAENAELRRLKESIDKSPVRCDPVEPKPQKPQRNRPVEVRRILPMTRLEQQEKEAIKKALASNGYNVLATAKDLNIGRNRLIRKMKNLRISN